MKLQVLRMYWFTYTFFTATPPKRDPSWKCWIDCTEEEMEKLSDMFVVMGMNPISKVRVYWSAEDI